MTGGAEPPVDDFRFVHHEVGARRVGEEGERGDGRFDVLHRPARSADGVVVPVAGARVEKGRGTRGFDAADQTPVDERRQGVINRLERDGSEFLANVVRNGIRRAVRAVPHGLEHRQPLGGNAQPVGAQEFGGVGLHEGMLAAS